jgi:DNA-binding MarR family transcriptional regulator
MPKNARGTGDRRRDRDRDDDDAEDLGLVDGLVQLSFLIQGVLGEIVGRHDLSIIQARLLGILRDRAPTMQELAAHLNLDKSSMTGLVDRAERRGLVERTPSSSDRRAVHVALTKAGRDLARTVAKEVELDVSTLASRLPREGRKQLSLSASALVSASGRAGSLQ